MAWNNAANLRLEINILIVLNIITYCLANPKLLPYKKHDCAPRIAVKIAEQYYSINHPTIIWDNDATENDFVQLFSQRYTGSLLLVKNRESRQFFSIHSTKNSAYHVMQYIIHIKHVKDFENFLHRFKNESIFANYGKFVIICYENDQTENGCKAEMVFRICWNHYLANVIFLRQAPEGEVTISTYFPMEDGLCDTIKEKILGTVNKCTDHQFVDNPFPKKFYNFNGCPLIVSTFIVPPLLMMRKNINGVEIVSGLTSDFYKILCKKINATLKLRLSPLGTFNGTHWTGSLDDLMMQRANFSVGNVLHLDFASTFRLVYPYQTVKFGWVSPPVPLRPAWEKLVNPFDFQLRLSFIVIILLCIIVLLILKETRLQDKWNTYFTRDVLKSNLYINTYAIFCGQVVAKRPVKAALACCVALWMWFSFFMLNAYQGALVSVLKEDLYVSDLNSVSNAIKAGYGFGGGSDLKTYFAEEPEQYKLYKDVDMENMVEYFEQMSRGSLKFILQLPLDFVSAVSMMNNQTYSLHFIPNDFKQEYLVEYLQTDSPLENTLSDINTRMAASGIFQKFENGLHHFNKMGNQKFQRNLNEDNALLMHHMQACFSVIIGGWILSMCSLLIELIWKRYERCGNSKSCKGKEENIDQLPIEIM